MADRLGKRKAANIIATGANGDVYRQRRLLDANYTAPEDAECELLVRTPWMRLMGELQWRNAGRNFLMSWKR